MATAPSPDELFTTAGFFDMMNGTETPWFTGNSSGTGGGMPPRPPSYVTRLKLANEVVLAVTFSFVVIAMGASVTPSDFKIVLRRPIGVVVGLVSQFVILPLVAFCYALAVDLDNPIAVGCLILASCPGGSLSNLYTFWTDGDVCLSIVMTSMSTLAAIGLMPLNLLIYSRRWTSKGAVIPYLNIFISLLLIIIPVAIGMALRWWREKWAKLIAKPFSLVGFLGIICSITFISIINPRMYASHWTIWIGAVFLSWFGFGLGYLLAFVCRQSHARCRTIGFETGVQNVGLAFAIISFTFRGDREFAHILTFPALFGPMSVVAGVAFTAGYQLYSRCYGNESRGLKKLDEEDDRDNADTHVNINYTGEYDEENL